MVTILCYWCSYAAADSAGVARLQQPVNVRIIRVICTGRVSVSHLLETFRLGADMVWISGCHFGGCHYVDGNTAFERRAIYADNVRRLPEIIDRLGPSPIRSGRH
ncbi:MAG: hydrogenase iron-sulfur subunit [Candidatus Thorarchaeota archaeon]